MTNLRTELRKYPILKFLSSVKIAVVCLILLFILTFWGTVDQVYNGLYHAQQQYFNSWGFLGFGFLPFPGAQLVMWVLFINLSSVAITRFVYKLSHLGILIIHIGLLTYFISAFVTFFAVREAHITLYEGEGTNLASSYNQWELSAWREEEGDTRQVVAHSMRHVLAGANLDFKEFGFNAKVDQYYPNSEAYAQVDPIVGDVLNGSGIRSLKSIPPSKEPEKNLPGALLHIQRNNEQGIAVLLYGGETMPTKVLIDGKSVFVQLRTKKIALPFVLTLSDFRMEKHPNTEIARSYESMVQINNQHMTRDVLISMNKPLRYKDFTAYQSSYSIDSMGRESSTLAVVKNVGRLLPYISTFITFLGLAIHFLFMGVFRRMQRTA